ncbi:hypothetical protein [Caballeronia sp. J97]|uniref:hypothetical protein n=1 Tax=Caballeronia sp. J97 TaxID=2805429 RepID=UPI002AB1D15A|nr:hypothetical protein [Caballeronia sp. J97]
MLTKGAETALRAVEAARGVTRHFQEPHEVARVRWFVRPRTYEARLPAPASVSSSAAVLDTQRSSHSILATVAMAAVVLGACFIARAYFEQRASTPRAAALPVAVAGTVGLAAPKVAEAAPNIDSADRIVDGSTRAASYPSVQSASPLIPVTASGNDGAHQSGVVERSVDKKDATPGATRALKTTSKPASKPALKSASKTASKPAPKSAACPHKSNRACVERAPHHASKPDPKPRQTRAAPRAAPGTRPKTDAKEFQKVTAIAQPVKPAMTADDSWRPSKKKY